MSQSQETPRYSKGLLEAVRYLLTVTDSIKECDYSSDFITITAEPGETLSIVRHNAYAALANYENPTEAIIPEDALFIRVEQKIQEQRSTRLVSELGMWRAPVICAVTVVGISAGGLFWTEDVFQLGRYLGFLVLLFGLPNIVMSWLRLQKTKKVLRRLGFN